MPHMNPLTSADDLPSLWIMVFTIVDGHHRMVMAVWQELLKTFYCRPHYVQQPFNIDEGRREHV